MNRVGCPVVNASLCELRVTSITFVNAEERSETHPVEFLVLHSDSTDGIAGVDKFIHQAFLFICANLKRDSKLFKFHNSGFKPVAQELPVVL